MSNDLNDDGYLLLAVADDFLAAFPPEEQPTISPDDAYDWLVRKAREVGGEETA